MPGPTTKVWRVKTGHGFLHILAQTFKQAAEKAAKVAKQVARDNGLAEMRVEGVEKLCDLDG